MKTAKRWLLTAIWLLPLLVFSKVYLLLIAEPRTTVNYVAEYNQACRPQNYDPAYDAAPHYQKALNGFVYMPALLRNPSVHWPGDFSEGKQAMLEKWLVLNSQNFEHFRTATGKPYCWLERQTKEENNMFSIMLPELLLFCEVTKALTWEAKFKAMNGDFKGAFGDIIACYRAACHKCNPRLFLTTQHAGLGIKGNAIRNAFIILDKSDVGSEDLEFFQNALQVEVDSDIYVPDMQAERYFVYDALQQTFVDNGRGTGRLAWSAGWYNRRESFKERVKACFLGPTRNQIIQQTDEVLAMSNRMMSKTPWQVESGGYDYFEEISSINNSNCFLQVFGLSPEVTFHLYHTTNAQTEALIAVLAVLRFKADTGGLPGSLEELVTAGYLRSVPMDPYSGKALVYRVEVDDFELYSVGEDFLDNGGPIGNMVRRFIYRKRRAKPRVDSLDIIYWPVRY